MLTEEAMVVSPLTEPTPSTNFPFTMAVPQSAPPPPTSPSTRPLPDHHCAPAQPAVSVVFTHIATVKSSLMDRGIKT